MSHIPRPWPAGYRLGRVNQASSIAIVILEDADRGKPGGPPIGDRGMTGTGEVGAVDQLPVVLRDSANKRKRLGSIRYISIAGLVARDTRTTYNCVYVRYLFKGGEFVPPKKTYNSPRTGAKLCALNLFFGEDNDSQIYHGNFLLMDNKHRKLFVIKQSKVCKFMYRMHRYRFGGRAPPDILAATGAFL